MSWWCNDYDLQITQGRYLLEEAELASLGLKFGKRILQKIFLQLNFVGGYQKHEGRVGD